MAVDMTPFFFPFFFPACIGVGRRDLSLKIANITGSQPLLRPQQLRAALHPQPTTTPAFLVPSLSQLSLSPRRPQKTTTTTTARGPTAAARFSTSTPRGAKKAPITTGTAAMPRPPEVPEPTPFVPDVRTFLMLIGRGLSQHAAKFPSWESLFSLSSEQLRELGIEPPRTRRYLLQWRQRFRRGHHGIGGDLRHVEGGVAELRVLEVEGGSTASNTEPKEAAPAAPPRKLRFVVNVPAGTASVRGLDRAQMSRVRGYKVQGARTVVGPYAVPLPLADGTREGGALITATEGMWENRRGRKIDGGERRRTLVRYKKRIAERREMREKGLL